MISSSRSMKVISTRFLFGTSKSSYTPIVRWRHFLSSPPTGRPSHSFSAGVVFAPGQRWRQVPRNSRVVSYVSRGIAMKGAPHISEVRSSQELHNSEHLIVIGSGVAGCATALVAAAKYSIPVTLICAGSDMKDCNSYWAQGGIIYRNSNASSGDSAHSLMADIMTAGAGLCDVDAVAKLAIEGPGRVQELLLGGKGSGAGVFASVPFDRDENGDLSFCLEASHSAPRIIHYADHSGKAIIDHITRATHSHPLITVMTNTIVTDLITESKAKDEKNGAMPIHLTKRRDNDMNGINGMNGKSTVGSHVNGHYRVDKANCWGQNNSTGENGDDRICFGVHIYDKKANLHSSLLSTRGVTISSGGLCGIYTHSTNPSGFNALGSSVALALRAGAKCADLEYVQFHPTALNIPGEACFLLTEALRGEGAKLVTETGYEFARDFHPKGELAPRDIVARGVFKQMQQPTDNQVYLDITHREAEWLKRRFPSIQRHVQDRHGLDITKDKLPITPAAHYSCGGISSDEHGRTNIGNLYVAGEAARTGLHGGNRLASTSLLEGLVWGSSIADFVGGDATRSTSPSPELTQVAVLRDWAREEVECYNPSNHSSSQAMMSNRRSSDQSTHIGTADSNTKAAMHLLLKLRGIMWDHVGVLRTPAGLASACESLDEIRKEAEELYQRSPSTETIMLRDASYAGIEVARVASVNNISRGAHFIIEQYHYNSTDGDVDDIETDPSEARAMVM